MRMQRWETSSRHGEFIQVLKIIETSGVRTFRVLQIGVTTNPPGGCQILPFKLGPHWLAACWGSSGWWDPGSSQTYAADPGDGICWDAAAVLERSHLSGSAEPAEIYGHLWKFWWKIGAWQILESENPRNTLAVFFYHCYHCIYFFSFGGDDKPLSSRLMAGVSPSLKRRMWSWWKSVPMPCLCFASCAGVRSWLRDLQKWQAWGNSSGRWKWNGNDPFCSKMIWNPIPR